MLTIGSVDRRLVYRAFTDAFADYAMDTSGTTEEGLLLRMRKNAVDFNLSPGLYDGDRLVGFTLIGIDEWGGRRTAYDAGTGIVAAFRRRGWARRMFEHALPSLRERGVEQFALEVLHENKPAIKAYRKSGFEITRELRCLIAQTDVLRTVRATQGIEIRPIDREDLRQIERYADWLPSFENRFGAVDALSGDVEILGALVGGTVVGALAYVPELNWLLTLVVDSAHRRRGIGTALVSRLTTLLPPSVSRLAALNVDETDAGMLSFFESLGFAHLIDQHEMIRPV
jgi:ribosomal protein S18 acetylase RimI-like enzyme